MHASVLPALLFSTPFPIKLPVNKTLSHLLSERQTLRLNDMLSYARVKKPRQRAGDMIGLLADQPFATWCSHAKDRLWLVRPHPNGSPLMPHPCKSRTPGQWRRLGPFLVAIMAAASYRPVTRNSGDYHYPLLEAVVAVKMWCLEVLARPIPALCSYSASLRRALYLEERGTSRSFKVHMVLNPPVCSTASTCISILGTNSDSTSHLHSLQPQCVARMASQTITSYPIP